MKRLGMGIIMLLLLACAKQAGATTFASKRLKGMAEYLSLNGLDTLKAGSHDTYTYKGRPLVIRVNKWGEVEHIGLKLFMSSTRKLYPSPVYDFLERYLLERNASPTDTEEGTKMQWDKVYFAKGSAATALQIDTTMNFTDNHVDLKVYRVAWSKDDKTLIQMSFDMDYQLLTGCTEIELEEKIMRELPRMETTDYESPRRVNFPSDGDEFIRRGDFFITPLVRNDLYYTKKKGDWQLVCTKNRMSQSVSNLMMNPNADEHIRMQIVVDQYGYKKDTLDITYRQFIQLCLKEGCTPYFGMKDKSGENYSGSVFMVNRQGGYLHLLSAEITPECITKPKSATIKAKLFAYIPLFNVSDKVLNPQNYHPINK